jgi:hypothetical protein
MTIVLTEIKNSNTISKLGYDAINQIMEVWYHRTGLYKYYDIPVEDYKELAKTVASGESVGKHVKKIIEGKTFKKVI